VLCLAEDVGAVVDAIEVDSIAVVVDPIVGGGVRPTMAASVAGIAESHRAKSACAIFRTLSDTRFASICAKTEIRGIARNQLRCLSCAFYIHFGAITNSLHIGFESR
jgi:hypothetical protein